MKLVIIANPVSGRGRPYRKLQRLISRWPYGDWQVEVVATQGPEHAAALARDLRTARPDMLAVCGGDGTLSEVASGLPDPPFPVLVLPGGTANVMARELGLPLDPVAALAAGLRGSVRRVDLGILTGGRSSRFLLFVGAGFDAFVAERVRPAVKARLGIAAYYLETLRALAAYRFPEFEVAAGDETLRVSSCLVAGASRYGGGLVLTPEADMSDGLLDLLAIRTRRKRDYLRLLFCARLGRAPSFPWIERRRIRSAEVRGGPDVRVQADGEIAGTLPVSIALSPAAFPLVVPAPPR